MTWYWKSKAQFWTKMLLTVGTWISWVVYKSYLESKARKSRLIGYYIRYKQAANWHWRVARDDKSCEILMKWRFGWPRNGSVPSSNAFYDHLYESRTPLLNNNNKKSFVWKQFLQKLKFALQSLNVCVASWMFAVHFFDNTRPF